LAGVTGRYLADACALIVFYAAGPMSRIVRQVMQDGDVAVSSITVWEITRKVALGKLPSDWGEGGLAGLLQRQGFRPLPLSWSDAERANGLPPIHKDPMDRMLIAQAMRHGLEIITNDRLFDGYGVKTVW
jgi:PIN domain nuclease of toxin-antitoxin system